MVSITDNAPGNPQVLELVGAGQGPLVSLSAMSLNFGPQPENINSLSQSITVANVGNQALSLGSPVESGPDVAQFFLSGRDITCGPTLAPGASCSIGAVFAPKSVGTFHALITLSDNSRGIANSTQAIALVGTATAAAPVASVEPSALTFGSIQVGTASGAQQVTLLNTGSIALNIASVLVSGSNAADFAIANAGAGQCPQGSSSLAVQASCGVNVRFAPSASDTPGSKSAALVIMDNAAGSPQTVALSGTASSPPLVQVAPASLHFAPQSSGTPSVAQIVTVTNTGASPLSISGFSISGTNLADFRQTNNCPPSLGGGASCIASVVFEPTFEASASRTAILSVADNASGSPQSVALSGSATQAGIQIVPSSINFSGQQAGTASSPQTITVTNSGTGNLSFSSVVASGGSDFIVGANTCSASQTPPGGNCTIQLTFSPACTNGAAARSASLTLADNVPGSPQSVPLSGTATGDFCFAPAAAATVAPGATATYTIVVNSPTAYKGTVSLTCANFPSASTCNVPASVNVPSQFAVSVATVASSLGPPVDRIRRPDGRFVRTAAADAILAELLTLLAIFAWRRSGDASSATAIGEKIARPCRATIFCAFFLSAALYMAACSGGGGDPPAASTPGTPAGSYAITVSGASTSTSSQITLALTVQ